MSELTPESEALLALWDGPDPSDGPTREELAAIEAAAAKRESERLRALYMATDAGQFCNVDVHHEHAHEGCNARCWCSWADPENCPYPVAETA